MRRCAPHRALPDESSLIEIIDYDDSASGASRSPGDRSFRPSPPRRWTHVIGGGLVGLAFVLTFLVGRETAGSILPGAARAGSGCDRPSYRSHLVDDRAHPDALTVLRDRLPDFKVLAAQRAVYADTLQLCRIEIQAADGDGVHLRVVVALAPAPSRNGSAAVTVRPTGEGAVTDLALRAASGLVVTVEVSARLAEQAPALSELLELLADPELAA